MIVIGVDPGLTGAVAFVDTLGQRCELEDIPTLPLPSGSITRRVDGRALAEMVRRHVPADRAATVVCEQVNAFAGNAIQTQGSLLRSLGAIEAVFDVLRYPAALVTAKAWQGFYGMAGKKAEKRARGELPRSVTLARDLYPQAAHLLQRTKDHNRAEALLIAHYGARTLA